MRLLKAVSFILFLLFYSNAQSMLLIIDEETEEVITKIAHPIFKAAQLPYKDLKIKIVNDDSINAFVMDNTNVFIFTGLLTFSEDPEVLAGVIAHECAHIALGHIASTSSEIEALKTQMIATTLLGAAAGILSGSPEAMIAMGAGGTHVAQMNFLKHSRIQESQADAAAIQYLKKIKLSADGLTSLLKYLSSNERIFYRDSSPYLLSHPVSKERINYLKHHNITPSEHLPVSMKQKYKMVVAKVFAFTSPFKEVFKKYKGSEKVDIYAHSIAYYKIGKLKKALEEIDKLIALEPSNPYFIELKAQFLFENGKVSESIKFYKEALKLRPRSTIFKIELAYALITNNSNIDKAIELLRSAIDLDSSNFNAWHGLGIALSKKKLDNYSYIALARAFAIIGDTKTAKKFINTLGEKSKIIKGQFYLNALEETKALIKS